MFFSIVTVTRNNREGLRKTAETLQSQSCKDFEWIIVDGDSQDETAEDFFCYDAEIVSEPDHGIYDAMNKGILRAKGDYILFLNAGDCLADDRTLSLIYDAVREPADFIYGDAWENSSAGAFYKPARSHEYADRGMFTHHQAMLYRRSLIAGLRYDLHYRIAADYDFTLKFLALAKSCLYLSLPICCFEAGGVSQQNADLGRQEQFLIRKNLKYSLWQNQTTKIQQFITWNLRRFMPLLYWKIRSHF